MISRSQAVRQEQPHPQQQQQQHVASNAPHRPLNRPALPSKLSNVRSASQHDGAIARAAKNQQPAAGSSSQTTVKQESALLSVKPEAINADDEENASRVAAASVQNIYPFSGNALHPSALGTQPPLDAGIRPQAVQPPKPTHLPLPARPSFLTDSSNHHPPSVATHGRRDPARRANGIRPPAVATALPRGKAADFLPWTGIPGAHPEDVLTELTVKNGYNDKGTNQAAESNIARPAIWPGLKNKSGLHILSALFCQVLDKRQQMGRCTAPSTFKPPPRVTLTDTKREAWLKDLANPQVPLRRLSRTIPHGIRGKVLLDHCISKDIPVTRAVWLSKCVGANEIRAFKRKGVSGSSALAGEIRWIREWTVCVEQFIEGIVDECGQKGWGMRMNYAVRLATHFYSEHLLDAEHYIDWLLASLESSSLERLPVWILLTQVYWKHFVSQRKRGRRLAEALMEHAHVMMDKKLAPSGPLVVRLQQLITILAVSHQGCLVMPKTWAKYKSTFDALMSANPFDTAKTALANATRRNARLFMTVESLANVEKHTKQRIIHALDQHKLADSLPTETLSFGDTAASTKMSIVLEWASSRYRQGNSRMYLAARILRHLHVEGYDTDGVILHMLEKAKDDPTIDISSLYNVISLLTRSGHFSVGKYLQWLISIGALSSIPSASSDANLLLELPIQNLPPYILNLRRTILNRMGFQADYETNELNRYQAGILHLLHQLESTGGSNHAKPDLSMLATNPSGATKFAMTGWLCHLFTTRVQPSPSGMQAVDAWNLASDRGLEMFSTVRYILERFGDFVSLSQCLNAAILSASDSRLLASLADTVNMHTDIFAAMGTLFELTNGLRHRQDAIRTIRPLDMTLLHALSSLAERVDGNADYRASLAHDLRLCQMQGSAAACSPASDSMAMQMADDGDGMLHEDADIDRVLTSGNTMDEQLFDRMFRIIADRAAKAGFDGVSRTGSWFSQLRRFDPTTFDQLLPSYINDLLKSPDTADLLVPVVAGLVGSGCMSLDLAFRITERVIHLRGSTELSPSLEHTCLELVLPPCTTTPKADSPEMYKFKLEQKLFGERHKIDMMRVIFDAVNTASDHASKGHSVHHDYTSDTRVLAFLRHHISNDRSHMIDGLLQQIKGSSNKAGIQRLLFRLIQPSNEDEFDVADSSARSMRILACVNELSLPFCRLAMDEASTSATMPEVTRRLVFEAVQREIERDGPVWPAFLDVVDKQVVSQIHDWARSRAITLITDFVSSTDSSVKMHEIRQYLSAADLAAPHGEAQNSHPQGLSMLNEHLASLGKLVDFISPLDISQATQRQRIGFGLGVLLQITSRHYNSLPDSASAQPELGSIISTLCHLLLHQNLQTQRPTLEHIFDVASIIIDLLPQDAVKNIACNLPAFARHDPRIRYLFGITVQPDSWLALASKVYPQPPPAAHPNPMISGQQAPLASATLPRPSHPLPPRPGGAGLLQRSPSMPQAQAQAQAQALHRQQPQQQSQVQHHQQAPPTPGATPTAPVAAAAAAAPPTPRASSYEVKCAPFQLRRWEIMPDPTPNMGLNDTSLSLGLFQARKVG